MKQERNIAPAKVHPVITRLTEIRLAWQLSQQEVADRIGCRLLTLQKIERGSLWPSFKLMAKWTDVLGYDLSLWPKATRKYEDNCRMALRNGEPALNGAA